MWVIVPWPDTQRPRPGRSSVPSGRGLASSLPCLLPHARGLWPSGGAPNGACASGPGSLTFGASHEASFVGVLSASMPPHQARTLLASWHETVVGEGSNVAGMVYNRRLAQSLAEQSLGRVRQQLGEKATWRGGRLLVTDRLPPSSTTCSASGTMSAEPTWPSARGEGCDLVIGRGWAPQGTCSGLPSGAGGLMGPREGPALRRRGGP
jgi:hypothetical protein